MTESPIARLYQVADLKTCPIETTFRIIGRKWTVLVLRELFRGVRRFNRLQENIEGITSKILAQRLRELHRRGIVDRQVFSGPPVRVEYRLTDLGQRLEPTLCAAAAFSISAFPEQVFNDGPPRSLSKILDVSRR